MKRILNLLIIIGCFSATVFAQDSIYIFRSGAIAFQSPVSSVDSITFKNYKASLPAITSISPSSVSARTNITITGTNFSPVVANNTVLFNNIAAPVVSASATSLVVTVPFTSSGNVTVTTSAGVSNAFPYNYIPTVLIAGTTYNGAQCWRNNTPVFDGVSGEATSVFACGTDIYVAGRFRNESDIWVACYWKNGTVVALTDGTSEAKANSIYVSGSDVYVAGYIMNDGNSIAKYWKNGTAQTLTNGTEATSVFLNGTDVYVSGYYTSTDENHFARYWKNGSMVSLNSDYSTAYSIFVSGTDIYVAGHHGGTYGDAVYWKNGTMVTLPSGTSYGAEGYSVYVNGTDVYVAGQVYIDAPQSSQAGYWKNGVLTKLTTSTDTGGRANSIYVYGSDVYTAGNEGSYEGKYWKNSSVTTLVSNAGWCSINSIIIK
jgi:hypothetical protein